MAGPSDTISLAEGLYREPIVTMNAVSTAVIVRTSGGGGEVGSGDSVYNSTMVYPNIHVYTFHVYTDCPDGNTLNVSVC